MLAAQGEEYVADYLTKRGYTILARNYRIRGGEIDIIARKAEVVAMVEVKTRTTEYFNLSQVIVPTKQRSLIYAARHFLAKNRLSNVVVRFDVALVYLASEKVIDFKYMSNAFTAVEGL